MSKLYKSPSLFQNRLEERFTTKEALRVESSQLPEVVTFAVRCLRHLFSEGFSQLSSPLTVVNCQKHVFILVPVPAQKLNPNKTGLRTIARTGGLLNFFYFSSEKIQVEVFAKGGRRGPHCNTRSWEAILLFTDIFYYSSPPTHESSDTLVVSLHILTI